MKMLAYGGLLALVAVVIGISLCNSEVIIKWWFALSPWRQSLYQGGATLIAIGMLAVLFFRKKQAQK